MKNISETIIFPPNSKERILPTYRPAGKPLKERDIGMAAIGEFTKPYEIIRTSPLWHVAIMTLGGKGKVALPHGTGSLSANTIWVAPVGFAQHYWAVRQWKVLWFHILNTPRWDFLREYHGTVRTLPGGGARIHDAMEAFLVESMNNQPDSVRLAESYAEIIGIYLERILSRKDTLKRMHLRHQLDLLWQRVSVDLRYQWTVGELSKAMHLSHAHFHRLVLELGGISPMQCVTRLRMEKARSMLLNTDCPLYQIAERIGYKSQFSFSRTFSRYVGMSPSDFRLKMRPV
jgi:AraC-like DNA-binding protein